MKFQRLLFLILFIPSLAFAGQLEDGKAAFNRKEWKEAIQLLGPLAVKGNAEAQLHMGYMCEFGNGVEKDPAEALAWFMRAANKGNARAQFNVGYSYKRGLGVKKDNAKAMNWLRRAADQGDGPAQQMVGGMYANGEGVKQDWRKAYFWFLLMSQIQAENDNDAAGRAAALRERYSEHLTPKQITEVEQHVQEWRPVTMHTPAAPATPAATTAKP